MAEKQVVPKSEEIVTGNAEAKLADVCSKNVLEHVDAVLRVVKNVKGVLLGGFSTMPQVEHV